MKRKKAPYLSEAAILGRAKSLASDWVWAIALQIDRIKNPRPQDILYHRFDDDSFLEADIHFLIIALRRLRTSATTIEHVPSKWPEVEKAINEFDNHLPSLKTMRDVFEHLEDYAVDSNKRRTNVSRSMLQTWVASKDGIQWMDEELKWDDCQTATRDLFETVKAACVSSE